MSLRTVLCLIFIIIGFEYGELHVDQEKVCQTPDLKTGICVPTNDCKTMKDFLNNLQQPISNKTRERLNEYYCGVGRKGIKICCPSEPIQFEKPVVPPPPPPDVSNHKNLHLLVQDCGLIDAGNKISGGEKAALGEFPWMALLSYQSAAGPSFECGGTIINDRYILTAAHCLKGTTIPLIGVRVGEYDISKQEDCDETLKKCSPPPQDLTVEKVLIPSDYDINFAANDIGLVRVSKINFEAENIRAICLPINEELRNQEFTDCVVTGWGLLKGNESARPDVLQKVELPTQPLKKCEEAYKNQIDIQISYKQMCIGGTDNRDSCKGDSGGPLHTPAYFDDEARFVQQGIVSFGNIDCGTKGFPAIYTRVVYYLPWILDNIEP